MASLMAGASTGQNGRKILSSSAILEKKISDTVRHATPDSEALASSDDDHDQGQAMTMSLHSVRSLPSQGPARRPSWLNEIQAPTKPRKFSLGGVSHASTGSQPTTPSGEHGPWDGAPTLSRSSTNGSSYPWNQQVWHKDRSRLMEMTPSEISLHEDMRSPTSQNHQMKNAGLPFEIPLHPSRKTVRSQSYSAGQLEIMPGLENTGGYPGHPRMRPNLMHRPSRPSILGEGARDALASLREDEDDVQISHESDRAHQQPSAILKSGAGREISTLARVTATSPLHSGSHRYQPRTSAAFPLSPGSGSDYAVADDTEEPGDTLYEAGKDMVMGIVSSTTSSATNLPSMAITVENRRLEGLKRSQWQSSLGFDVAEEGNQSRRHSFAELPTRTRNSPMMAHRDFAQLSQYQGFNPGPGGFNSLLGTESFRPEPVSEQRKYDISSKVSSHQQLLSSAAVRTHQEEEAENTGKTQTDARIFAASYFAGVEAQRRHMRDGPSDDYNPFAVPNVFNSRPVKILYLVAFKCNRADIYYIPENTGLQVKAGDTVIVEGDRGQDLGTVERVNITMDQAKLLKEEYTQKHFRCLMMFSRLYPHIAALAGDDQAFANSISGPASLNGGSLLPGVASTAPNFSSDPASQFEAEPRPKMVKRVARPDEVNLLRDKEGNEAKAKRVCQTKVNDHGLRMEILDAEFQHDYRKLTFFYYAEEYINFNELVTDLFKVYKTRIWMSAINPSTYMAMNPNTHPRPPQTHRPGQTGHAAPYLRAQEDYRTAIENGGTGASIDRDGPAARGNREFDRMMQMQNTRNGHRSMAHNEGPAGLSRRSASGGKPEATGSSSQALSRGDFPVAMQSYYDSQRTSPSFPPNGHFPAFPPQYGPNLAVNGNWPQNGTSSVYPLMFPNSRDSTANYSISSVAAMPSPGMNQQAAVFTPRGIMPRNQAPNHQFQTANESEMQQLLNEQFQRFSVDSTRRP